MHILLLGLMINLRSYVFSFCSVQCPHSFSPTFSFAPNRWSYVTHAVTTGSQTSLDLRKCLHLTQSRDDFANRHQDLGEVSVETSHNLTAHDDPNFSSKQVLDLRLDSRWWYIKVSQMLFILLNRVFFDKLVNFFF